MHGRESYSSPEVLTAPRNIETYQKDSQDGSSTSRSNTSWQNGRTPLHYTIKQTVVGIPGVVEPAADNPSDNPFAPSPSCSEPAGNDELAVELPLSASAAVDASLRSVPTGVSYALTHWYNAPAAEGFGRDTDREPADKNPPVILERTQPIIVVVSHTSTLFDSCRLSITNKI